MDSKDRDKKDKKIVEGVKFDFNKTVVKPIKKAETQLRMEH